MHDTVLLLSLNRLKRSVGSQAAHVLHLIPRFSLLDGWDEPL